MIKKILFMFLFVLNASFLIAASYNKKVAVLEFENQATSSNAAEILGNINANMIAQKGIYALSSSIGNNQDFRLIDRHDFLREIAQLKSATQTKKEPVSYLKAAQSLNADAVIKGALISLAPGTEIITQGGYKTRFVSLSLRVMIQALDTIDGTVIAVGEGSASRKFRQSHAKQTRLSEDQVFELLKQAVNQAVGSVNDILNTRLAHQDKQKKVLLSVKTDSDPAIVEIDGMVIGTTPLNGFKLYAGDHKLTVGKAGYRDVNKYILINTNTAIEIPLLKTELDAEELKDVLENMRMDVLIGVPESPLIIREYNRD
jgi:hypothetical protein